MNSYTSEISNKEYLDAIQRMALVAQYQTANIENHIKRIRRYTYTLALGMDLSGDAALTISYASQLHDVGEAGVPASILAKAGELSAYDWEIVKRHTTIGAEMLSGSHSNLMQMAEMIRSTPVRATTSCSARAATTRSLAVLATTRSSARAATILSTAMRRLPS